MGKISLKTLSVMAVSVVAISAFSGCSQSTKEVKLFKDASIMNNYMDGVSNFDSVEYEQITYTDGTNGLGPSDKRYRGQESWKSWIPGNTPMKSVKSIRCPLWKYMMEQSTVTMFLP